MITADIAIIGAGMAGASLAASLGSALRVLLIEAEAQPGYHATGRSAAFWSETYGGPAIQPLTTASHRFLAAQGFLQPRGALTIARADGEGMLRDLVRDFADTGVQLSPVDRSQLERVLPSLRPDWVAGVSEPSCQDIDVAALHAYYLATARKNGVHLLTDTQVTGLKHAGSGWLIQTRDGEMRAGAVANAAGAWASAIGTMAGAAPIEILPMRRTVVQLVVDPPASVSLPLVIDARQSFYIKPEAGGRLWLSPHDEAPSAPCDAAPAELDIAIAIDRFERAFDWRIVKLERSWAGLRSFAPDRAPVYGFDPVAPGFFWFAGQGGFGIQTAPAAAEIGASLILDQTLPEDLGTIDIARYLPDRF